MSKLKYSGKTLYTKTCVDNILITYELATEAEKSFEWYESANRFANVMAEHYREPLNVVCGVIAALSPLKSWEENKRIVEIYLETGQAKHTRAMTNKAKEILLFSKNDEEILDILKGNKISNFFLNMLYPKRDSIATVDRHALSICLGRSIRNKEGAMTTNQYNFFQRCFCIAAQRHGITTNKMQSVTWEAWRRLKKA